MLEGNFKTAYDLILANTELSLAHRKAGRKEKKNIELQIGKNIEEMKKIDHEVGNILLIIQSDEVRNKNKLMAKAGGFIITESFIFEKLKEKGLI